MGRGDSGRDRLRDLAVGDAIRDFASALRAGDARESEAAINQLRQLVKGIDPIAMRERMNVPEDAGEWEEGLVRILSRIPDGWGRWIRCGKGWYPLVCGLDMALAELDPDYEVHQVKEKFGTLSYYAAPSEGLDEAKREQFEFLIGEAEAVSASICENCTRPGSMHKTRSASAWYRTLCGDCAATATSGSGEPYLTSGAWEAWWAEEQPRYLAAKKARFAKRMQGRRVIVLTDDPAFDRLSFEATVVREAEEAQQRINENWDEVWVGSGEAAEAAVAALAERYRDHYEAQKADKEAYFARAHAEGKRVLGYTLKPPADAPTVVGVGSYKTRVSRRPLNGYGFRESHVDPALYLA